MKFQKISLESLGLLKRSIIKPKKKKVTAWRREGKGEKEQEDFHESNGFRENHL